MAILAAWDPASIFDTVMNVLYVALGLGLVIFFHELGHFAVAKWCDVNVERFSIGFGPILWSRKKGETEYAISAIPFGGYVKMLGQDDADPSQLSSEEIAQDPRSYSAKPVLQRMAIISAGVIMNVVTGMLFYASSFSLGVETSPSVVGAVQTGYPAWEAGITRGDRLTNINGRPIETFGDIMRGIALSSEDVTIEGVHRDGSTYKVTVTPDQSGTRRIIGAGPTRGLKLFEFEDPKSPVCYPGTPAERASVPFKSGDLIRKVGETDVLNYAHFQDILAERRGDILDLYVQRKGRRGDDLVKISIEPRPFRTLGMQMDIGPITSVRKDSPAAHTSLQPDDKITHINDRDVGNDINPLELPDLFASLHGQEVVVRIRRPVKGGDPEELSVALVPMDVPGWVEVPVGEGIPLSVPSIGVAFHLIPTVMRVEEGSPAALGGIQPEDRILKMQFSLPKDAPPNGFVESKTTIEFGGEKKNWAYAFWLMQTTPTRDISLTFSHKGEKKFVEIVPWVQSKPDWFFPDNRGILFSGLAEPQRAESLPVAIRLGWIRTQNSITDIYLTLRNLVGGQLSYKELHGPVGIAAVALQIADQGLAELLLFLGFLSVNLAVLNFLPIPVLDGGHMVFLIWEAVTRKRPSERVLEAATYLGMAFVLGLMILVLYLDIFVHRLGFG